MTVTDVPTPVVGSLSPSRAGDFMACPLLYRFRVVDRLPEPPNPVAARGTVVHAVLEQLFDLPAAERTLERAVSLLEPQWQRLLTAEPELAALVSAEAESATGAERATGAESATGADTETNDTQSGDSLTSLVASAADLLRRYFELEDPRCLEPAERELFVETVLDSGLALRGYVDRLDIAPGGDMRVVDYKTGRAPRETFEAKALFQMRFYALVLWRLHARVPRVLQLLYLGSGEVLRYEPDEADLRATERKVDALWAAIRRASERADWRPNPSRLCEWCSHHALCPAFGGIPPPLPERPPLSATVDASDAEAPSPRSPADEI
jgi:putative RecB family exonuclease